MTDPPYGDAGPGRSTPRAGRPSPGPPPHGPPGADPLPGPGYGPPGPDGASQPPGRGSSRVVLLAVLAAVTAALVAGITALALSAGPVVLSRAAVERDVAAQFEQQEGVAVDLRCAEEMAVEEGASYECAGVTTHDEEVTLRIEITDEAAARYTWTEP